MAKFTLSIDCDSGAFSDDGEPGQGSLAEVGRILGVLAAKLQRTRTTGTTEGGLLDGNGFKVGVWSYVDEEG